MPDIPDPPIARAGSQLAREIYPEPRCQCSKCGGYLPESQTTFRWPCFSIARICWDCRREEQGDD